MTIPNILTISRIVLVPLAILALFIDFQFHFQVALVIYVIAAFSDFVDGYLARKLKQETNFGILLDPLADKLLHILLLISLFALNVFPLWIVMLLIAREIVVDAFLQFASTKSIYIKPPFVSKFKSFFIDIAVIIGELAIIVNDGFNLFGLTYDSLKLSAYIVLIIALILGAMGSKPLFKIIKNGVIK